MGFELLHGHWRLSTARQAGKIPGGAPRGAGRRPVRKDSLLHGPQEEEIENDENDRNDHVSQRGHDHGGLLFEEGRRLAKLRFSLKRDILERELVAALGIETNRRGNEFAVLLHLFGFPRFVRR